MAISPTPVRYTSGVSTDFVGNPLANFGAPHPFKYHSFEDDFDNSLGVTGTYTKTTTGNGTIAQTAGDGGLGLFTTNSSTPAATDLAQLQLPSADFSLPTNGKKTFFLTRVQWGDVTNPGFVAGLVAIGANTYTTPADGIYFYKAAGGTALLLRTAVGGVVVSYTIPTTAYSLVANTNIDLGFYLDRNSNLFVYVGTDLVGYYPVSGYGSAPSADLSVTAPSLTTANLSPTLAITSGTTASKTMTADFLFAAKER
jgi:hypothetical protein